MKLIFEGSKNISVNEKHRQPQLLNRQVPLLATTNMTMKQLAKGDKLEEEALRTRTHIAHLKWPIEAPWKDKHGPILDQEGNLQLPPGKDAELRQRFELKSGEVLKWHPTLDVQKLPSGRKSILPSNPLVLFNAMIRYKDLKDGDYQEVDFGSVMQPNCRRGRYH